ncbi:hypothetical protein J6590_043670 [Homalodisca vitripennis]|nr:hypothetical protein J6590_043670 [Homalodisca vitripennis]
MALPRTKAWISGGRAGSKVRPTSIVQRPYQTALRACCHNSWLLHELPYWITESFNDPLNAIV